MWRLIESRSIFLPHSLHSLLLFSPFSFFRCDISFKGVFASSISLSSFDSLWTILMWRLIEYGCIFLPHSGHSTIINVHFKINSSIFDLIPYFSRNVLRSVLNSSVVPKQTSLRECGSSFKMFAASVWWETACSLKMSTLSEQNEHIIHLNSFRNELFFSLVVLHSPNRCFIGILRLNFIWQFLHWYGLRPVWILLCRVREYLLTNDFSQTEHLCFLVVWSEWTLLMCSLRMWGPADLYGHMLHGQVIPWCLFILCILSFRFS